MDERCWMWPTDGKSHNSLDRPYWIHFIKKNLCTSPNVQRYTFLLFSIYLQIHRINYLVQMKLVLKVLLQINLMCCSAVYSEHEAKGTASVSPDLNVLISVPTDKIAALVF